MLSISVYFKKKREALTNRQNREGVHACITVCVQQKDKPGCLSIHSFGGGSAEWVGDGKG